MARAMSDAARSKFECEYGFYRAVMDYNFREGNRPGARPIKTTEARLLHSELLDRLAADGVSMDSLDAGSRVTPEAFRQTVNDLLTERMGGTVPYATPAEFDLMRADFRRYTGMGQDDNVIPAPDGDRQYMLPISPFDERFQYREAVWRNGSSLLFVNENDAINHLSGFRRASIDQQTGDEMYNFGRLGSLAVWRDNSAGEPADVDVTPDGCRRTTRAGAEMINDDMAVASAASASATFAPGMGLKVYREGRPGVFAERPNAELLSRADLSGASALLPFAHTRDEYNSLRQNVTYPYNRIVADNGLATAPADVARGAVEAARGARIARRVCLDLRAHGTDFTVGADLHPGQARVNVTSAGVSMRVLDEPGQGIWAGRMYDARQATQWYPRSSDAVGYGRQDVALPLSAFTPEMASNALMWMQGAEAHDSLGRVVGSPALQVDGTHGTYHVKDNKLIVGLDTYNNGRHNAVVQLVGDYSDMKANHELFNSTTEEASRARALDFLVGTEEQPGIVKRARGRLFERIDLEGMVELARDRDRAIDAARAALGERGVENLEELEPDFSDLAENEEVLGVRRGVWEMLANPGKTVIRPGSEMEADEAVDPSVFAALAYPLPATDDADTLDIRIERCRQYVNDFVDWRIGDMDATYETDADGVHFDIGGVAEYAEERGRRRSVNDVVEALRTLGVEPDDIESPCGKSNRIEDRLVRFDESSAVALPDMPEGFRRDAMQRVADALRRNACVINDADVRMDDNGIIHYDAQRALFELDSNYNFQVSPMSGELGPVFERTERGTYRTAFRSSDNYELVPHHEMYVMPAEEGGSFVERHRAIPFEERVLREIDQQVRKDVHGHLSWKTAGTRYCPWSLAHIWTNNDDMRLALDWEDTCAARGVDRSLELARIQSETEKYVYRGSKDIQDACGVLGQLEVDRRDDVGDLFNDNLGDVYREMDSRRLIEYQEDFEGLFDPNVVGANENMSTTYYIVEGAELSPNSAPTISPDGADAVNSLWKNPVFEFADYDVWARRQMTVTNIRHALSVTSGEPGNEHPYVAFTTFGGWTNDDGVVVSDEFAEKHMVPDADGNLRPLRVGDKLSDAHGNKGVVSLVVDRSMSDSEAAAAGLTDEVNFFTNNPKLDLIMPFYSHISRANLGTAREAMSRDQKDLKLPDGSVVKGGMSQLCIVIHDKTAESKTNVEGRRKLGWQLSTNLYGLGCDNFLEERYSNNNSALERMNEAMTVVYGSSIDTAGNIRADDMSGRAILETPDDPLEPGRLQGTRINALVGEFGRQLAHEGGMLAVPFEVTVPEHSMFVHDLPEGLAVGENPGHVVVAEIADKNGGDPMYRVTTGGQPIELAPDAQGNPQWGVPVLSHALRESFENDDGETFNHEYTKRYEQIYRASLEYKDAVKRIAELEDDPKAKDRDRKMAEAQAIVGIDGQPGKAQKSVQRTYNAIAEDLRSRAFSGRKNWAKTKQMTTRMDDSPSAIWSANPKLRVDEMAFSPVLATKLGIEDGDTVIGWRDPVLDGNNVRSFTARIDDTVYGVAVHPGAAVPIGGDFDGDQVGVTVPKSFGAVKEAKEKLSMGAGLLDRTASPDPETGEFPLSYGFAADTAVGLARHPELKERLSALQHDVNEFEMNETDSRTLQYKRKAAVNELNDIVHAATDREFGTATLSMESPETYLRSFKEAVVDTGAKGNMNKMHDEMSWYLGVDFDMAPDENGKMQFVEGSFVDHKSPMPTTDEHKDAFGQTAAFIADNEVRVATSAKTEVTGIAGAFQQRAIAAFGEHDRETLLSALRVTRAPYQGSLDLKTNGTQAVQVIDAINTLSKVLDGAKFDADGKQIEGKATVNEFMDKMSSMRELINQDYNMDDVRVIAQAMNGPDGIVGLRDMASQAPYMQRCAMSTKEIEVIAGIAREENVYAGEFGASRKPQAVRVAEGSRFSLDSEIERFVANVFGVEPEQLNASALPKDVRENHEVRRRVNTAVIENAPQEVRTATPAPAAISVAMPEPFGVSEQPVSAGADKGVEAPPEY